MRGQWRDPGRGVGPVLPKTQAHVSLPATQWFVALGQSLSCPEPQCPPLQNGAVASHCGMGAEAGRGVST